MTLFSICWSWCCRGHMQWLQLDRRVLEHEFPTKKSAALVLFFAVRLSHCKLTSYIAFQSYLLLMRVTCRFFIESISYLHDSATIELFFLQAKHSLYNVSASSPVALRRLSIITVHYCVIVAAMSGTSDKVGVVECQPRFKATNCSRLR